MDKKVIYMALWLAARRRRPDPERGIVSVDLELFGETLEEYFANAEPIDTIQETLLAQIEAGEVPARSDWE